LNDDADLFSSHGLEDAGPVAGAVWFSEGSGFSDDCYHRNR